MLHTIWDLISAGQLQPSLPLSSPFSTNQPSSEIVCVYVRMCHNSVVDKKAEARYKCLKLQQHLRELRD